MSATFCLSPKMLANLRAIRAGEPWPHLDTAVPQFAAIPPNFLVKGSPWRLTPDGVAVLALADERDALRKRVADFERLLTEPKVEQARLLALRDLSEKLYTDGSGYTTVEARQDEILSAFLDVVDEALAANLHRRLNKGVAGALGLLEMQKDPETGESYLPSWHDLPERVAALVQEGEALREQVKAMTDERAALLAPVEGVDPEEVLRLGATTPKAATLRPRSAAECREGLLIYAAPLLARGVIRLRAALRLADKQSAEAIRRVSSEILADKWNSTAELQQKVKAMTTDLKHVEHALGDRLKPGQTLERAIADLIADLDRAGVGAETQKPAER